MAYQHYLPASYLANFSSDNNKDRRKRVVWVGDKNNNVNPIRKSAVARICGENDYYFVDRNGKKSIDALWEYERFLVDGIDKLINANVDSEIWLKVLVPFITCLFIRSKEFGNRFQERVFVDGVPGPDKYSINNSRVFELQRVLCPILTSEWIVLTVNGKDNLLVNDVGFIPFMNLQQKQTGFAIPLDKRHILVLCSRKKGKILGLHQGSWVPVIKYMDLPKDNHIGFNKMIARYSHQLVIGESRGAVEKYFTRKSEPSFILEPHQRFKYSGKELAAFEFSWHQLVSFIDACKERPDNSEFSTSWESVSKYWKIPIVVPLNLMEFPSIFTRVNNDVVFECYNPKQYFIFCSIKNCSTDGDFRALIEKSYFGINQIKDTKLQQKAFILRQAALSSMNKQRQSLFELKLFWHDEIEYLLQRANNNIELKLFDTAISDLKAILLKDEKNEKALMNLGVCYASIKSFIEAKKIFESLTLSNDKYISTFSIVNIAILSTLVNDYENALKLLRGIDKEKLNVPELDMVNNYLFMCYFETKRYDDVKALIEEVKTQNPNNISLILNSTKYADVTGQVDMYLFESAKLLKTKIPNKLAAAHYSKRSRIFLYRDELGGAEREIKQAIQNNFYNAEYHSDYNNVLLLTGKYFHSVFEAILATILSKGDGRAINGFGVSLLLMGFVNTALFLFKTAMKHLENNKEFVLAGCNAIRCYIELKNYSSIQPIINRIDEIDSYEYKKKIIKTHYYYSIGDFEKAIAELSSVIESGNSNEETDLLHLIIFKKAKMIEDFEKTKKRIGPPPYSPVLLKRYRVEIKELNLFDNSI